MIEELKARANDALYFRSLAVLGDVSRFLFHTADAEMLDAVNRRANDDTELLELVQYLHFNGPHELR